MRWLTKTRFMAGSQCHKRLWFEVHQPLETVAPTPMPVIQGRQFDRIVQQLEPGIVISRSEGLTASIELTQQLLKARDAAVLYQAAFGQGDLAAVVDVLRKRRAGVDLVEVKGSTGVKDEHLRDVAFQALVLQRAEVPVRRVFIGHVDNRFVLREPGQYAGIKREVDVTDATFGALRTIETETAAQLKVLSASVPPTLGVGAHCRTPYDCPFIRRCTTGMPEGPEYPIGLLPRGGRIAAALQADGYRDLREVPADRLTSDIHKRVHAATVSGKAFLDPDAAVRLKSLEYPRSYLDFETVNPTVPEVVGTKPFEQWPFQFSLHIEDESGSVRHLEYLALDEFGDFDALAAALVAGVPATGPVFVYSASMEKNVLKRLAKHCPVHHEGLMSIVHRLVDLLPLTQQTYYHPDMKGSWSIKNVLPTIDPTLGYELLDGVSDGMEAQRGFFEARDPETPPERREQLVAELRTYCNRDTWGMVVLRRFLSGEGWTTIG